MTPGLALLLLAPCALPGARPRHIRRCRAATCARQHGLLPPRKGAPVLTVTVAPAMDDEHPHGQALPGPALAWAEHGRRDRPCRASLSWPPLSQSPERSSDGAQAGEHAARGLGAMFLRRPSAAAGCARLASLACSPAQHQDHQVAEHSAHNADQLPPAIGAGRHDRARLSSRPSAPGVGPPRLRRVRRCARDPRRTSTAGIEGSVCVGTRSPGL